ncbi:MAG: hypothetical protein EAX87_14230 [Candidatus Thorarchaeota archaeon]|nr:hypothetical protein [Candidatus Thorarchaeota archaeon]
MGSNLKEMTTALVENLHQTWLYKAIEEWCRTDALELREELGLTGFSITSSDPIEMYQAIKRMLLERTFHDEDTLQFLMRVPSWAGFSLAADEFQSGQQLIGAARDEAIALLWLMAIPKLIISPNTLPEEYPIEGVHEFINMLLSTDESRSLLVKSIYAAMESKGIPDIVFQPSPISRGYVIDESMRTQRLRSLIVLVIMRATSFPYVLDEVFGLNEDQMVEEATAYIISMQAKMMLRNQISGGGGHRHFDWPLIGNPKVCDQLLKTLNVLTQSAVKMMTCSSFSSETNGQRQPWNHREFLSFLINELTEHYSEIHRIRHGKNKNVELSLFIDLLTGENIEIAQRLLKANNPGAALFEELSAYKQKAKIGEKPQISPERRFRVILSTLKQRVSDDKLEEVAPDDIVDQVIDAFDAIFEVVEGHKNSLADEAEKFAQALCFETAYRILQLLEIGEALIDLPWVSRFIAEESARSDISIGDIDHLDDEHRIRRIVSAYAGGLTYLILQSSKGQAGA